MKKLILYSFAVLALIGKGAHAQAIDAIKGTSTDTIYAGYSVSGCGPGCLYTLSIVLPPGFTVTDIQYSLNYRALGTCHLKDGGYNISLGTCKRSCFSCLLDLPGSCIQQDVSIYDSLKACVPPRMCVNDTLIFVLDFYRNASPGAGCAFSCIVPELPWIMNVIGTLDTCPTGIPESSFSDLFKIYPNPSQGNFTITSNAMKTDHADAEIYNVMGEQVYSGILREEDLRKGYQLNLNASNGLYLLVLRAGDAVLGKKISILK